MRGQGVVMIAYIPKRIAASAPVFGPHPQPLGGISASLLKLPLSGSRITRKKGRWTFLFEYTNIDHAFGKADVHDLRG